jgi:pyruvate kinase
MQRRAKIIATVGPATADEETLKGLLQAGTDVVRVNFAHGTPEEHAERIQTVRRLAHELGRTVGVLADLPGPKMRTGSLDNDEEVQLRPGETFVLSGDDVAGNWERVSTTVNGLSTMTSRGDEVYLADGAIVLRVTSVAGNDVVTEIVRGGRLRSGKGMHLPRAERHVQAFTDEDRVALERAVAMKVDLIGLSFVRDGEDVRRARSALPKGSRHIGIVGKVETRSAVDNLDEIIEAADAVMVARGDLGIQMPLAEVPALQKRIIRACNLAGKPVITATQMLESMTRQPLPTRAEAADVANAVLDGTHALMLSEETAIGPFPLDAVREMASIATAAERSIEEHAPSPLPDHMGQDRVSWAVAHAACQAAEDLGVAAILCPTRSGSTALRVAAFRPQMQIIALSERQEVLGGLNLVWGVTPLAMDPAPEQLTAEIDVDRATTAAYSAGFLNQGDHVAIVAGTPGRRAGRTDYVRVVRV